MYQYSRAVIDKRLASEIEGEALGQEFKGYVFKITGGCDKQGFPMKQGVLVPGRVRLLLSGCTPLNDTVSLLPPSSPKKKNNKQVLHSSAKLRCGFRIGLDTL